MLPRNITLVPTEYGLIREQCLVVHMGSEAGSLTGFGVLCSRDETWDECLSGY